VKTAQGKKKQRLESQGGGEFDPVSAQSLQSLLLCLEACLRADAHDGGNWVRDGDSQRYNVLLGPLGKLLQCRIPVEGSGSFSYQSLIQGSNTDSGSVVGCLVSLASAAGDEQLWKPLNHSVLQACSHESRAEVRKAGVACLLSLIRSIGEEYMVLIPECLPVLSELLEDSDEEIAGLAQDCISLSEELLGESLQDSLR
jgi:U3 small nucleolar RNA-associated protein 10